MSKDRQPLSRRDFLRIAVHLAAIPFVERLKSGDVWDADRLQWELNQKAIESLRSGRETFLKLPSGETVLDRPVRFRPGKAKVVVEGDSHGSCLRLHPSLSDVNKNWGSFAESNILDIQGLLGKITFVGVNFHGGSERAGLGGYKPPESPWDATVLIVGAGKDGTKYEPSDDYSDRHGEAILENCNFLQSESAGLALQNLNIGRLKRIRGLKVDCVVATNWCNEVFGEDIEAGCLSDGIASFRSSKVSLINCKTSGRQAYGLYGVDNAYLEGCEAYDSAKVVEVTNFPAYEERQARPSGIVKVFDLNSFGCMNLYCIGAVEELRVVEGVHKDVGGLWYKRYNEGGFLHTGIANSPGIIRDSNGTIVIYDVAGLENIKRQLEFSNVSIQTSENVPPGFERPKFPGVRYIEPISSFRQYPQLPPQ